MPCFVPGKAVDAHLPRWFVKVVEHTSTSTNVIQFHGYATLRFSESDTYLLVVWTRQAHGEELFSSLMHTFLAGKRQLLNQKLEMMHSLFGQEVTLPMLLGVADSLTT